MQFAVNLMIVCIIYNCCCYDENLEPIVINYPTGKPPMKFKETKGLNCDTCELGVVCHTN